MYRHRPTGGRELSLLARGQGMLDGGVEIDCFSHDTKAYSLSGKPLLRQATSRSIKPYKAHKLNLPKTFVTRRGQMVLFTSPEDMIIGSTVSFNQRETTSQQAAVDLKTTGRLLESAMDYHHLADDHFQHKHSSLGQEEMEGGDAVLTQPGHFTDVYLSSLQRAARAKDCSVEDIEDNQDELPTASECDSGLGQSTTSRLSALSRLSHDNTPLVIPHGGDQSSSAEPAHTVGPDNAHTVGPDNALTVGPDNDLASLKKELLQQKNGSKTKRAANKPNGKKRQRQSNKSDTTDSTAPSKLKSKKTDSTKTAKSKRKRNKKDANNQLSTVQHNCNTAETAGSKDNDEVKNEQPITAVNLSPSNSRRVAGTKEGKLSKAEERQREAERKRAEKRELEAAKKKEMEERQRLEEELARQALEQSATNERADTVSMTSVDSETHTQSDGESPTQDMPPLSNQARLRVELYQSRLSQHRWLLLSREEEVGLEAELAEADQALAQAREAEQRRQQILEEERRKKKLEDEQRREQAELEEAARLKAAGILSEAANEPLSDHKKRLDSELASQRHSKIPSKQNSFMFSYFNYVPRPNVRKEKKLRGRAAKTKTAKAQ